MAAVTAKHLPVELFSTCPPSSAFPGDVYRHKLVEAARWSEAAGCTGTLVYTDNAMLDPWLVSQLVIETTEGLSPLVAVQPAYMHPYSVAKMVASLGSLHGRRVHLNMVSGGFRNDLLALNDQTPHDKRYVRLTEYTTIIRRLLEGGVTSLDGEFYRVDRLRLAPRLPATLLPETFVSGSSGAGLAAAAAMNATAVKYPKPAAQEEGFPESVEKRALRVGIIARASEERAWQVARDRFPGDRKGQLTHQLAMKVSDSVWHRQLSDMAGVEESPYWLFPFENYKTMCPYLVGSHARVAAELSRYLAMGVTAFILDVPPNRAELEHTVEAFRVSLQRVA
jgi:alkanesulfonate monooxygenase